MFRRHLGVLRDLHITAAWHGLTADVAPSQKIAPFANGEELPFAVPGVGDQSTDNPARIAFAQLLPRLAGHPGRHRFRFSPLCHRRDSAHHRPLPSRRGEYLYWATLLPGS